ncbi:MAG TPA: DUF2721 domain-containing protein [Acetobacteraceae bacterium]|nr:DUF2721 domain-containing protein [Acetobacteraceae bacterium]
MSTFTLQATVHLIQIALTPVFLLSGIAALLNVYSARLNRVSDRLDALTSGVAHDAPASGPICQEIAHLHRRSLVLDVAVVLATVGAAATCLAILTLFLLELSNKEIAGILITFFGIAVVCTLGSVGVFGVEMILSNRAVRLRMHVHLPFLRRRR